jgi:hypothetical protein
MWLKEHRMTLRLTGGFAPGVQFRTRALILPPPPFVAPNAYLPPYYSYVYDGATGFTNSGMTMTSATGSGIKNAAFSYAILGGYRYMEWKIQDLQGTAWLGFVNQTIASNTWKSYNPLTTSAPSSVMLGSDGRVYVNGTATGTPFPQGLKIGDTVGFALNSSGIGAGLSHNLYFHVNGVWKHASGVSIAVTDITDKKGTNSLNTGTSVFNPFFITVGATGRITATLNAGQLESNWKPDGYDWPYSLNGDIGLRAGAVVTQVDRRSVQMTTNGNSVYNARSDRPVPNGTVPMYFEISTTALKSTTRFGWRHYKYLETVRLGSSTGAGEEGWEPFTGLRWVYGNNGTGMLKSTQAPQTYGIARRGTKTWIRDSRGWIQAESGDPSTLTGGYSGYADSNVTTVFAINETTSGATWTLNAGKTPFAYPLPTGFQAWNDVQY